MRGFRVLWARVVGQVLQSREDAALVEEIHQHITLLTEGYQKQGMNTQDAERAARRQFGNVTLLKEQQRGLRGMLSIGELWRDVRFGIRMLAKKPGLHLAMVLTLALGIGANTTVFSIVDAVLLRPLPYAHPEQLMEVRSSQTAAAAVQDGAVCYPDFFDWRAQSRSFAELVSYHSASLTLTGVERAEHLDGEVVSWNLLPLAGVRPERGLGFKPEDEKAGSRVVMISHALWVSQFGSDPLSERREALASIVRPSGSVEVSAALQAPLARAARTLERAAMRTALQWAHHSMLRYISQSFDYCEIPMIRSAIRWWIPITGSPGI